MILDQMVDVLVEFIEKCNEMYRKGNLTLKDYDELTAHKISFLEKHLNDIKIRTLRSRCESLLLSPAVRTFRNDMILH